MTTRPKRTGERPPNGARGGRPLPGAAERAALVRTEPLPCVVVGTLEGRELARWILASAEDVRLFVAGATSRLAYRVLRESAQEGKPDVGR